MTLSRRLRLSLIVAAGVLAAIGLAVLVTLYLLLQPDRFTAMLQSQARGAGLDLSLASPARPALFPHPALELEGLTLTARGANAPILLAARGRLALPWRTIFGGPTAISQLEIDSPRVDLDALQAWLNALPPHPASTPIQIPRIDTGVRITRGSLVSGNHLLLSQVTLDAGSLMPNHPFLLDLSAQTADGTPMHWQLSATPQMQGSALELHDIALHITHGSTLQLQLAGTARWDSAANASLQLHGTLDHKGSGNYATSLTLAPANQLNPLLLTLKLDGKNDHVDLRLPPLALAHWWSRIGSTAQAPQLTVPPGDGYIDVASLDIGGAHIEGLSIQAGSAVPASNASSAAPASTAGTAKPPRKPNHK
ncbi:membrane assembly protein AsmA [Dyella sp. A6]|uniref:membrane assembly protein AsmA n=1 Tax=Dyella aluminiiresistens TaxID=3069105 RepID=UPI002E782E3F|nr:membrane assembly protein AsmA [Dyella sp. A6]